MSDMIFWIIVIVFVLWFLFRSKKPLDNKRRRFRMDEINTTLIKCNNRCVRCGSRENLSIDHKFPLALGGLNELSNYQILCKSCNSKKGKRI